MSYKSKGNFELKFINDGEFEIICDNKGQVLVILDLLRKADFASDVIHTIELSDAYPDKINGKTTKQDELLELLKGWHETLAEQEVSEYKD